MTEFLGESDPADEDPHYELALIAEELRTYLEWQAESGAHGLPRDPDLGTKLKRLAEEAAAREAAAPDGLPALQRSAPQASAGMHQYSGAPSDFAAQRKSADPSQSVAPRQSAGPGSQNEATPSGLSRAEFGLPDLSEPKRPRPAAAQVEQPPVKRSLEVLGKTLDELSGKVASCTACALSETRTQTVFSRGSGASGLCFIGEGPGADEDAQGEPFVGAAGQLLDKMIEAMGFSREEVYICNIVKCRPPENRKPLPEEMSACADFLERQIELLSPQVIVALGGTAVEGLLGISHGITKVRGKFRLYQGQIAVMPTFHPAYLLRNPSAKRQVWTDLRQVVEFMGRTLPKPK